MSDNTDTASLHEQETVTVNEQATAEGNAVDPNSTESTDAQTSATETSPELDEAAKAEAEAKAKAAAEAAEAEKQRIEQLAQEFIDSLGKQDDNGNWVSGLIVDDEKRESSTGQVPDGVINDLRAKFNELPTGHARTRVKNWVDAQISEAMEDPARSPDARTFFMIKKHALVSVGSKAPDKPRVIVDPTEAHVEAVVALYLAPYAVRVPEGVKANWGELVDQRAQELMDATRQYAEHQDKLAALPEDTTEEARAELEKQTPDVPDVVKQAFRHARGRATTSTRAKRTSTGGATRAPRGDGTRKNIGAHILNAFEGKAVGTVLSIAEIVKTRSPEYGDESPSPGAVSARLFPDKTTPEDGTKCTIPNIQGTMNAEGRKAAVKTA